MSDNIEYGISPFSFDQEKIDQICQEKCDEIVSLIQQEIVKTLPSILEKETKDIRNQIAEEYMQRIMTMENQLTQLQKEIQSLKKKNASSSQKQQNTSYAANQRDSDFPGLRNLGYSKFEYSGWIFYINEKMGDCLYKVRIDGTDNTRLTDFSVYSGFKVRGGYLFFYDKDYNTHKIKI